MVNTTIQDADRILQDQFMTLSTILRGRYANMEKELKQETHATVLGIRDRTLTTVIDDVCFKVGQDISLSKPFEKKSTGGVGRVTRRTPYKAKNDEDIAIAIRKYMERIIIIILDYFRELDEPSFHFDSDGLVDSYKEVFREKLEKSYIHPEVINLVIEKIEGKRDELKKRSRFILGQIVPFIAQAIFEIGGDLKEKVKQDPKEYSKVTRAFRYKTTIALKEKPNIYYEDELDEDAVYNYEMKLQSIMDVYLDNETLPEKDEFLSEVRDLFKENNIPDSITDAAVAHLGQGFRDSFAEEHFEEVLYEVLYYISHCMYDDTIREAIEEHLQSQLVKPDVEGVKKKSDLQMSVKPGMSKKEMKEVEDKYFADGTLTFKMGEDLKYISHSDTREQKDFLRDQKFLDSLNFKKKKNELPFPLKVIYDGQLQNYSQLIEPDEEHEFLDNTQHKALVNALATHEKDIQSEDGETYIEKGDLVNPVLCIHGGSGSGKTTVLDLIAEGHIKAGRKVLVMGASNKSVQVPAQKIRQDGFKIHIANNDPRAIVPALQKSRIMVGINRSGYASDLDFSEARDRRKEKIQKEMKNGGIMFSTFGTGVNDFFVDGFEPDVVIIDEATKMRMPELIFAALKAKKQIIFIGDPKQLGNLKLDKKEREFLVKYLMEEMQLERYQVEPIIDTYEKGPFTFLVNHFENPEDHIPYIYLENNRRSKENIVKILSELHYNGKMLPAREDGEVEDKSNVTFFNTESLNANESADGTSKKNTKEAKIIVSRIIKKLKDGVDPKDIGIIATYKIQAHTISQMLRRTLMDKKNKNLRKHITDEAIKRMFIDDNEMIYKQKSVRDEIIGHIKKSLSKKKAIPLKDEEVKKIFEPFFALWEEGEFDYKGKDKKKYEQVAQETSDKLAEYVRSKLRPTGKDRWKVSEANVKKMLDNISTVDHFQGDQRKIIYMSLTRSNDEGDIGFLKETERTGVGIGRAEDELHVFGNTRTLINANTDERSQAYYEKMIALFKENGELKKY